MRFGGPERPRRRAKAVASHDLRRALLDLGSELANVLATFSRSHLSPRPVIESHARSARTQFGKASQAIVVPMTTLAELCEQHAPRSIDQIDAVEIHATSSPHLLPLIYWNPALNISEVRPTEGRQTMRAIAQSFQHSTDACSQTLSRFEDSLEG